MGIQYSSITSQVFSPRLVIQVNNEKLGKLGHIVIDRPVRGSAFGPIISSPDVSPDELISLARTLTYKWAFLNIPMGGAMGGISADPQQVGCDRPTLMERFGRSIAPLVRQQVYYPGVDFGMTVNDLRAIMRGAGRPLTGQQVNAAFYTGLTVFETIRQVAGFNGLELPGLRVALEGFGKVGSVVADLLGQAGAKLIALSTSRGGIVAEEGLDVSRLLSLKQQHGGQLVDHYPEARQITREALFTQPVDVLIPGARSYVIHADNADQVQARWVVPIANAPITLEAERRLIVRDVLVIPDFVANCGGVLAVDIRSAGFDAEDIHYIVETIFAKVVANLLQSARRERQSVGEIARAVSWQNHHELDNGAVSVSANKIAQISHIWKSQGLNGLWRRLAWQTHVRWSRLPGAVRWAAIDRFVEWKLGVTLNRVATFHTGDMRQ